MQLSKGDREALIRRVEERVGARGVTRASIEAAVDQVVARLPVPDETSVSDGILVALSAESMPDLASRVRRKLSGAGISTTDSGVATSGRHTVVALRIPSGARESLEAIAREIGARATVVELASSQGLSA
jgi:hypothetical protein